MTCTFMATDLEIEGLFYLKDDSKIAHYLGVSVDRVSRIRAARAAPTHAAPPPVAVPLPKPLPKPLEKALEAEPLKQESVLTPQLCPTCGAPVSNTRLLVTHIQALVAAYYRLSVRSMTSAQRSREFVRPRQVAMYLAAELTPKSLPEIGRRFNRDHTTIIHGIRTVQRLMLADPEIEADVKALRERLSA